MYACHFSSWLNELTTNSKNYSEIYKECTVPSSNWMMFRKDFNKINGFSNLNYPEDYDFAFRVLYKKIKIINTKKITHLWRDHPKRTSRNSEHYKYENFIPIKIKNLLVNELKNKDHTPMHLSLFVLCCVVSVIVSVIVTFPD